MIRNTFLILLMMYTPLVYAQTSEELAEELVDEPDKADVLTTDSLTKMQLDFKEDLALLKNERDFMEQKFNLEMRAVLASWQNEKTLYTSQLSARQDYIEQLEEKLLETDDWTPVYVFSSFVVGAITSIAITYALTGATK